MTAKVFSEFAVFLPLMANHLPWSVILALFLFLLSFRPVHPPKSAKDRNTEESFEEEPGGRIINGQSVHHSIWPFVASLMTSRRNHFCGGTVWNKDYILTAAHCLYVCKNGIRKPFCSS